uniref:Uncharacterized protein n=1 Tax=Babesia bovis TaxID=5865 RepID=S6B153_BABBO|nr:hypothetical protein [Babesia bovis]
MMVSECLGSCYNQLPQPEVVLSPEDSELNYYLWMPGVQYQPRLQRKLSELRSITAESEVVVVDEVVEEVVRLTFMLFRRCCVPNRTSDLMECNYDLEINSRLADHVPMRCST